MINRKHISLFCLLMLFMQLKTKAQFDTISQQVIGSTGGTSGTLLPWGSVDYTVGETIIWTYDTASFPLTVKALTQGFHQPNQANSSLDANVIFADASCIGGNNGSASINIFSSTGNVNYYWWTLNDSSQSVSNLAPGAYPVHIDDGNFFIEDTIIIGETQIDCADDLDFYTGITPNGDGNNDFWTIGKIELIKDNTVSIFNRWGDLVWKTTGYDNNPTGEKVWKGTSNTGAELPDATYFYVIEGNGRVYKGWVELTH